MIIPKYFEDNHIFGVNDEPKRAYYIPPSPTQDPDWKIRPEADLLRLLSGKNPLCGGAVRSPFTGM